MYSDKSTQYICEKHPALAWIKIIDIFISYSSAHFIHLNPITLKTFSKKA